MRPPLARLNAPYRWLLTLEIGSRVVRLCTGGPVTVTGNDGTVREFSGGLSDLGYVRTLDLRASSASPRSQSFTARLDFDLAQDVARGVPLYAATGELAQLYDGATWEQRRTAISGTLREPTYGQLGEAFSFALVDDPADDTAVVPPGGQVVQVGVTFLETATLGPDPAVVGAHYPLVIGAPGVAVGTGTSSSSLQDQVPATPALLVRRHNTGGGHLSDHWIMICSGHGPVSTVKIHNATDTAKTFSTSAFVKATDALGQPYTYVIPTSGNHPDEGAQLYTIWAPSTGGGTHNPFGAGTMRGAGDVIRWALSLASFRVDNSSLAALSVLNAYKLDTYINAPTSPWAWLQAEVLPLLPVSVSTGPEGLAVVPWLARAVTADQTAEHLEEGRNCTRESAVVYTSINDVYNELTIHYAPNIETGGTALSSTLTGYRYDADDPSTKPSYWCKRSQAVFGRRPLEITAGVVYDPATAEAILTDLARWHSHPRREILYTVGRDMDWLRPGDVVALTDADLHLSAAVGLVGSVAYGDDSLTLQVVLFEPVVFSQ